MSSRGWVRVWRDDEGWGVLDSDVTPGGCWAHFSMVLVPGYRSLAAGQAVSFTFEAPGQEGFDFRAVEVWPAGDEPVRGGAAAAVPPGYSSTLELSFGDGSDEGSTIRP